MKLFLTDDLLLQMAIKTNQYAQKTLCMLQDHLMGTCYFGRN